MATCGSQNTLHIRVVEDSQESGVFVVKVLCSDPVLMRFWCWRRTPFNNGQVEQTDVTWVSQTELRFVLRAVRRQPGLPNALYWSPFVLALCLDARHARFRPVAESGGGRLVHETMTESGALTLRR